MTVAGDLVAAIIRRVRCNSAHAWRGWDMTDAEKEQYANPNLHSSTWSRRTCRWCKDAEMPRIPDRRERERLLTQNGANQARAAGRDLRIGGISRAVSPGYGCCGKCGTSWLFVEGHSTPYNDHSACFPLCERCWDELTPDERLPYYADLILGVWEDPDKWPLVKTAVLEGK